MQVSEAILIFLLTELIAGIFVLWRFASAWGGLKQTDKDLLKDINSLGKVMRHRDKLTWQRLDRIEAYLQENYNYNPPSLNVFDDDR